MCSTERLAISEGFDVHVHRHGLKLLEQGGQTMYLANRRDYACSACVKPFDHLFVSEKRHDTSIGAVGTERVVRAGPRDSAAGSLHPQNDENADEHGAITERPTESSDSITGELPRRHTSALPVAG